jgi:amidase
VSGLRVAWAPDLKFDCPDLSEADEVFRVLRAWSFLASFGEQVRCSPE